MRVDGIGCLIRCRYIECTEKWLLTVPAIENSFFEDSGKKFVFWLGVLTVGLLSQTQKTRFWQEGFLVVEDAISVARLEELRAVFLSWVEESRSHSEDYGETLDGRPRFDLQPGHSAGRPALRRIQSPEEVSDRYEEVMRSGRPADYCAELIGPNIRFHHGKVNSKLPGSGPR